VRFAGIDFAPPVDSAGNMIPPPANLAALRFREEEGSFLVGALAALVGNSKRLVIGMTFADPCSRRVAPIQRGALIARDGGTASPEVFQFGCARTGAQPVPVRGRPRPPGPLTRVSRRRGRLAIGVDSDQQAEAPGFILTSMVKRVDEAVFKAVKSVKEGTFQGGIFQLGLAEQGVDYVYDEHNRSMIPDSVRTRVEALRADIIAGRIKVPSTR
jgi:basic membrane protein A